MLRTFETPRRTSSLSQPTLLQATVTQAAATYKHREYVSPQTQILNPGQGLTIEAFRNITTVHIVDSSRSNKQLRSDARGIGYARETGALPFWSRIGCVCYLGRMLQLFDQVCDSDLQVDANTC